MTDAAPVPFLHTRLGRFVAVSLIIHCAAGLAWGVPAYLKAREEARLIAEAEAAKQAKAAEARARIEAARLAKLARIKERIAERLRADHERLIGADIPEPDRSNLFRQVLAKLDKPMTELARALADADAGESDLRNLDAQLRREQIFALDKVLDERSAEPTAAAFRDEVASQVVPQLAEALKADFAKRAIGSAVSALDKERKLAAAEEEKLRKASIAQLAAVAKQAGAASEASAAAAAAFIAREAPAATDAARSDAKTRSDEGKRLRGELDRLAKEGEKLEGQVQKATAPAAQLSEQAGTAASAAAASLATARSALADARSAAAAAGKEIEAATAAVKAKQSLAEAASQSATAASAAEQAAHREAEVSAAVSARAGDMATAAEQAFVEQFRSASAPPIAEQLSKAFAARLKASGIEADGKVAAMRTDLQAMLATKVPELAGLAATASAALAAPAAPDAAAGQPAAAKPASSAAAGRRAAEAAGKVEAALVKGAAEAGGMKRNAQVANGAAVAAAGQELSLRERIAYLAKGVAAGRADIASAGAVGELSSLRAEAMALAGPGAASLAQAIGLPGATHRGGGGAIHVDDGSWKRIGDKTAGRDLAASTGGAWLAAGNLGPASSAEGRGPAEVVPTADPPGKAAASAPQPWSPTFQTIRFASVPCVEKPPVIDGDASDWAAIPEQELKPEGGSGPERQTLKLSWDPGGVNVLATLAWPGHQLRKVGVGGFWTGDSLEVWIDGINSKEQVRDVRAGQQFWGWPAGCADDPSLVAGESRKPRNQGYQLTAFKADQLPTAGRVSGDGWTIEMRIPAAMIANADLTPGRLLGFNAYLGTGGERNYYWATGKAAETWEHPNTWGDLLLAGSDGTIAVVDEQGRPLTRALAVGQPLRLEVRDRDMDLRPDVRDQVLVTVRTQRGTSRTAVLDETGPSTGVFTGALGTALAIDEDPPGGSLGVYEGERAEAVYIDQARANGARNAEIRLPIAFGSAVALTRR